MGSPSVLLGSLLGTLAAVLIMGAFFWGWASKGRRVARRGLDQKQRNHEDSARVEESEHPTPGADDDVPHIFLSHSGKQKYLVELLHHDLQRTNHTVFFDVITLPKGSPFPPRIKQAARGCKLGVVVLSEDFLTSLWPMLELEILILQRRGSVLPLFFELNPADLKSPKNLSKWRRVWKKMGGEDGAKRWEQAIKELRKFNGEVYAKGTSIGAYIEKVVQQICTLLPCHVPYDCSSIRGCSRLAQEIATKFECLDASRAGMVGLYGVGGLGKTTLCKVMVNHYSSHYCGRSFLMEFPSPGGGNSLMIASECQKALHKLTDASLKHLLNEADTFDKVVKLMRDRMGRHDVFLAVDNVWESYLEEAKSILQAGFSVNSKILVTSRSEEVLKDLLVVSRGPVNNAIVAPLPAPDHEEAFQIFQETFESYDLGDLVDNNQMNEVLGICRFGGSYHALALKALAKHVKRVCMSADSKEGIKYWLSCAFEEISFEDLSDVEKVIRCSYDGLSEPEKRLFLDIAFCLVGLCRFRMANVQAWISLIYWKLSESKIIRLINEQALDGLIQIEEDQFGKKLCLHDLYRALALREMASSPRFLVLGITEAGTKIEWEELEMVTLKGHKLGSCLFEKLQQCQCPKLIRVYAGNLKVRRAFWGNFMPSLKSLKLVNLTLEDNTTDSGSDSQEEKMAQSHLLQPLGQLPGLPESDCEASIRNSRTGFVRGQGPVDASRIIHLNRLMALRELQLSIVPFVEEIAGLDALRNLEELIVTFCEQLKSLDGLSDLVQLRRLHIYGCRRLQNLPDMSKLTCLKSLQADMSAIEEMGGLPSSLKRVQVEGCDFLKGMPDMSSLTRLKELSLESNHAMEVVGGDYFCSSLLNVSITCCQRLRSCPSFDKCMHLTRLDTDIAHLMSSSVQNILNLHTSLQYLTIKEWDGPMSNKEIESLHVRGYGDSALCSLESLTFQQCPSLKKLNVGCSSLKKLHVWDCKALEEIIWDLKALCCLELLDVINCKSLRKCSIPDIVCPCL